MLSHVCNSNFMTACMFGRLNSLWIGTIVVTGSNLTVLSHLQAPACVYLMPHFFCTCLIGLPPHLENKVENKLLFVGLSPEKCRKQHFTVRRINLILKFTTNMVFILYIPSAAFIVYTNFSMFSVYYHQKQHILVQSAQFKNRILYAWRHCTCAVDCFGYGCHNNAGQARPCSKF